MIVKADKLHLKRLLSDAIPLLCKNGLPPHSEFRVEAMIGITVDDNEVALICINETVTADGEVVPQIYGVDEDLVENEECDRSESGSRSVRNSEGCRDGSESYGGAISMGEFGVKQERSESLEQDMDGYENTENGTDSAGCLYDGKMVDSGGYERNAAPRSKNRKSFAAGSLQFVKEEFGHEAEDCVMVKEELGLSESSFSDAFGFQNASDNIPAKSRSSTHRVFNPGADFVSPGQTSAPPFPAWQSKTKKIGPLRSWKGPGNIGGKTSRNVVPASPVELLPQSSRPGYSTMIQDLCDSIMHQSTQNGEQFVCHICGAKLGNATTLRNHIRGTHLALKTERCNICGESFKWAMQLARHKKREHGDGSFIQIYNSLGGGTSETMGQNNY